MSKKINRYMQPLKLTYRIVYKKHEGYFIYQLQDVDGKLFFVSKQPCIIVGNSLDEITHKIQLFQESLTLPIINFEDIKDYTLENVPPKNYWET
jgi:hypothetical protein